jgi:hypothetical protein
MRRERIRNLFIEYVQKFMIFRWKNISDHNIWFAMLFKMLFYVFQNDRKQIYIFSLAHYIDVKNIVKDATEKYLYM